MDLCFLALWSMYVYLKVFDLNVCLFKRLSFDACLFADQWSKCMSIPGLCDLT